MKLLMHTCCAPCSVYCIDSLREEGIEPTIYWFNPNIHPYMEYKARRDCLKEYTQSIGVQAIFEEEYGLDEFCKNVICDLKNRCQNYCYSVRLEQTAKYAKEHGYDAVTTTLLFSINIFYCYYLNLLIHINNYIYIIHYNKYNIYNIYYT